MAVKEYKPTTPARRGMSSQDFDAITTNKPLKSLTRPRKSIAGRNNQGRITTRHKGGGVRRHYRIINFKLAAGTTATVEQIEYDPGRSARIARVKDADGTYHYILATRGMKPGRKFTVDEETSIEQANRLPLKNIPTGTQIHAIELQPGRGAQLVRSAGGSAQLLAKEGDYAQVRLPSGEVRRINAECMATIGVIGNEQHQNVKIGKAGRKRRMGIRPTVRGVVMNAADHPHGGGDGGRHRMARPPTTPWGQKTLGYKTRRRKVSSKFIVRTRHQAKRR
jgi:large subunit ribosomal protein L2